ncbi:hypothetical protein [Longibacter salinarum]|nr:hypothetical protein [Longibacter salinarum]
MRMEEGRIVSVHPDKGWCKVQTASGRQLQKVRLTSPGMSNAGRGFRITPRSNTMCVVLYDARSPYDRAFLVGTTPDEAPDESMGEWGAPGDLEYTMEHGGHWLGTQTGLTDFMASPWARLTLLPSTQTARLTTRNHERLYSPFSHDRLIQDDEAEVSFRELMVNSRFLYRDGDAAPNIIWTLGNQTDSDKVSPLNPKSKHLSFFVVENRDPDDGSTVTHRFQEGIGAADGRMRYTLMQDLEQSIGFEEVVGWDQGIIHSFAIETEDVTHERRWGFFTEGTLAHEEHIEMGEDVTFDHKLGNREGVVSETLWKRAGVTVTERIGDFEKTAYELDVAQDDESKMTARIEPTGRIEITNPTWTIDIEKGSKATITNGDTTFLIDGEDIFVGGPDGSEMMALGDTLKKLLDRTLPTCGEVALRKTVPAGMNDHDDFPNRTNPTVPAGMVY